MFNYNPPSPFKESLYEITHPPTLTARSSASIALRMHSAEFSGAHYFDFFTVKLNEASLCVQVL